MSKSSGKNEPTGYPEFGVQGEVICNFFSPPMPSSTFHERVKNGLIIPIKSMRGFYKLNDSLRRLGLREVPKLSTGSAGPSLEDIVRLAFTMIDQDVFPAPSWLLPVEEIDLKDVDHARRLADQYRNTVEAIDHVVLKLAYFQGVLDRVCLMKNSADS